MNCSDITITITKPENMDKLIKQYSIVAAEIIAKKLPKHSLNNLVNKLQTINDMNDYSNT